MEWDELICISNFPYTLHDVVVYDFLCCYYCASPPGGKRCGADAIGCC